MRDMRTLNVISGDNFAPVFTESGTVTRTIAEGKGVETLESPVYCNGC